MVKDFNTAYFVRVLDIPVENLAHHREDIANRNLAQEHVTKLMESFRTTQMVNEDISVVVRPDTAFVVSDTMDLT
jgi:hypothetical protein